MIVGSLRAPKYDFDARRRGGPLSKQWRDPCRGYISKLKAGTEIPSAPLVVALGLLARDGGSRVVVKAFDRSAADDDRDLQVAV